MGNIRPAAVAAGLVTTLASGWLLVLAALLTSFQPESSSGEYQLVAEPAAYFLLLAGEADVLSALLAACLLGDVVAGRHSPSTPGANGATAAAFGAVAGISWLLLAVLPLSSLPSMVSLVNPMTRSVEVGTLAFWAVAPLTYYLLALPSGYLGGTFGGRLRRPSESGAPRAG